MPLRPAPAPAGRRAGPASGPGRWLLAFGLFAGWLPWADTASAHLGYDAAQYWELFGRFFRAGQFSLLNYDDPQRGYAGPLLLAPAHLLGRLTHWPPLVCTGLWGAAWAAALFGWVFPTGWFRATGQRLGAGPWAALLALGWLFWRGYFVFPLLDGATLVLFGAGLLGLGGRRPGAWAAAGLALGLAVNARPNYLAAMPLLVFWVLATTWAAGAAGAAAEAVAEAGAVPGFGRRRDKGLGKGLGWRAAGRNAAGPAAWRLAALLLGLTLALGPQLLLNQRHFGSNSPFVRFRDPRDPRPVYLRALGWGTRVERYETGFFEPGGHRTRQVPDVAGTAQMARYGPQGFASYGQYAGFVARHPLAVAGRYARHLAHTFDLWYATPYPTAAHWPGQWAFRLLNYALLGLGALALWRLPRRGAGPGRWLLAALALPVLLTVPFHVETRYGMPLHLVLLLAAVAGLPWAGPWPRRRALRWALLAALWLGSWAAEAQRQERLAVFDPELET